MPPSARRENTAFSGGLSPSLAPAQHGLTARDQHLVAPVDPQHQRIGHAASRPRRPCAARRRGPRRCGTAAARCAVESPIVGSSLRFRASDVQQPVTELKRIDLGSVDAHQVAARTTPSTDVGQVAWRTACLLRGDFAFGKREPGIRSVVVPSSRQRSVCVAMPSSRPAVSDDTTVESAPDWRSRC